MRKLFFISLAFFFGGSIFFVFSAMNYYGYLYQIDEMKKYPECDHCLPASESLLGGSKHNLIIGTVLAASGGIGLWIDRINRK